ncbi:hypothetical protein [Kitasatospora sp. NPDC089509]|uniref:hypothetical protein n=1 Tax=Kitasatospora sp. NPDC089509 TaxID=3364079 RepID=UPI00382A5092
MHVPAVPVPAGVRGELGAAAPVTEQDVDRAQRSPARGSGRRAGLTKGQNLDGAEQGGGARGEQYVHPDPDGGTSPEHEARAAVAW